MVHMTVRDCCRPSATTFAGEANQRTRRNSRRRTRGGDGEIQIRKENATRKKKSLRCGTTTSSFDDVLSKKRPRADLFIVFNSSSASDYYHYYCYFYFFFTFWLYSSLPCGLHIIIHSLILLHLDSVNCSENDRC